MLVLGIDPGYAIVGWGVLRYDRNQYIPVDFGAITTDAGTDFSQRLNDVYDGIYRLCQRYRPDAAAVEKLFFTSNQKTVIGVAEARGVTRLALRQNNVPFFEYTPLQVKQAVVGYGRAVKAQVMEMTRLMLGLKEVPKPDDTADALAIAICHAHSSGSILGSLKQGGSVPGVHLSIREGI
ncbi:crossover junction endodeoxyribonuclease RuvC [[Clostridium] leptum]|uniref:Crossover junction endodeoxyribonuclease RuvC n=1 Tax=Solibaculum mannosilyticum TaxID=2780922 RepID=A0A7I8DAA7_9FIRM|nr:crossover junction endodeoxyribonuclease RuvC [Solibaculum mannosilyticum]MCO7136014.1 crossover junction endodeoxyribonuclease RuvC [[Clostridium] leptum]BCI61524.1 crossover junction endodeoxyribonuclease RuvC [Solibaculum mannosilyticum]